MHNILDFTWHTVKATIFNSSIAECDKCLDDDWFIKVNALKVVFKSANTCISRRGIAVKVQPVGACPPFSHFSHFPFCFQNTHTHTEREREREREKKIEGHKTPHLLNEHNTMMTQLDENVPIDVNTNGWTHHPQAIMVRKQSWAL